MNYTEALGHFIANSTIEDFSQEVVDACKKCFLVNKIQRKERLVTE